MNVRTMPVAATSPPPATSPAQEAPVDAGELTQLLDKFESKEPPASAKVGAWVQDSAEAAVELARPLSLTLPWSAADAYMGFTAGHAAGGLDGILGKVGAAMGAAHGVMAAVDICSLASRAGDNDIQGMQVQSQRALGDVTTAAGLVAIGAGAGSLALPVVLAGGAMINLAKAGAPDPQMDTPTRWSRLANETVLGAADTYLGWALTQPQVGLAADGMSGLGWFAVGAHAFKAACHAGRAINRATKDRANDEDRVGARFHFAKLIGEAVKVAGLVACNSGASAAPLIAIGAGISFIPEAGQK